MAIFFFVEGKPISQGRISTMRGRSFHSNAKELYPWRTLVAICGRNAMLQAKERMSLAPIELEVTFYLERPESSKRRYPTVAPDLDKFLRAIFDSLTGVFYKDDAQVVSAHVRKVYHDTKRGAEITVGDVGLLT